jgi:hypothetical protein
MSHRYDMAFGKSPHSAGMFERFIFSGILS